MSTANPSSLPTYNWKPWQLSPTFLIPLIVIAAGLAATLEALAQLGNKPYEASQARSELLHWYCNGSTNCLPSASDIPFYNVSESKKGLLTFVTPSSIPAFSTFLWLYFPTIFAVLYAIFWQLVNDEVKRIEPFYQVSRAAGAPAASTIFAGYFSVPPFLVPLQALRWGQIAVFLSSFTYVMVGFVTPVLQSQLFQLQTQLFQVGYVDPYSRRFEAFNRDGSGYLQKNADGPIIGVFLDDLAHIIWRDMADLLNQGVMRNVVYVDPLFARIQEAVLLAAVVSGSLLVWVTLSRPTGLQNSTKGLAAIASLATAHKEFLEDISGLVESQPEDDKERELGGKIVHLGWRSATHGSQYGLWFDPAANTGKHIKKRQWSRGFKSLMARLVRLFVGNYPRHYLLLYAVLRLSVIGNLFFIAMILVTGGTEKESSTQDKALEVTIRGSRSDIVSSVITLTIAAAVKTLWVVVEEQTTTLAPFRSLHREPRKAWPLLAREYASISPILRTFRAFQDRQYILGLVTTISLLLELGLICFGITASMTQGQAYNADGIWIVHWIAFTVSIAIIVFVAATIQVLFGGFPYLKRNPDTIGARLSYVCRSARLLEDVRPVSTMSDSEREAYLQQLSGLYGFGQIRYQSQLGSLICVNGVERLGTI
ncbi:MAG: hypothetical protein M1813_006973 [Trichoglossum hirsutum]|nr:MAG: hypothetical protein M1813_006973 [Trichoglossum hirsutum]